MLTPMLVSYVFREVGYNLLKFMKINLLLIKIRRY